MKSFIALTGCLLALAYNASSAAASAAHQCTFDIDILVKTGDVRNAGTAACVSLAVSGARGSSALVIPSLKAWGDMGAGYDYFERGSLDRIRGTGACLPTRPCKMLLSSDGSGRKPRWYVSDVRRPTTGVIQQGRP